ncbi:hypothetical protein ACP70R_025482 [Stipagrostis hirtigluma subsp. patula]
MNGGAPPAHPLPDFGDIPAPNANGVVAHVPAVGQVVFGAAGGAHCSGSCCSCSPCSGPSWCC